MRTRGKEEYDEEEGKVSECQRVNFSIVQ